MSYKEVHYTRLDLGDVEENFEKDINPNEPLVDEGEPPKTSGPWTFDYYQKLFDVDTKEVLSRLLYSFLPHPHKPYISQNPDLYGPFWTCTTLILTLAITGNMASYFQSAGDANYWTYDFKKLSLAAFTIYTYWWVMPLIIWGVSKVKKISSSLLELLSLYGYSLAIYIPISVFWVVQLTWLQWLLVLVALSLSGAVLVMAVWNIYKVHHKQISLSLSVFAAVMHAALSVGFMLYFFHVPALHPKSKALVNTSKST